MSVILDILCENTVGRPIPASGEHGFSCLVSTDSGRWLFDTGNGETLMKNCSVLGHDPADIDGIILSHGHNDHSGGLLPLLSAVGPRKVYAPSRVFKTRYWQGQHENRDISLPYEYDQLVAAGADFVFLDELTEIAPGFYYSGVIPRLSQDEAGDPHLVQHDIAGSSYVADDFEDDAALAIKTVKGLVIILGCAHAGLINTTEFFRRELREKHVHAIIGGTHLGPASDEQFEATVAYLSGLGLDRLGLSHCTGQIRSAQLYSKFPNKVFFANVGTTVKV